MAGNRFGKNTDTLNDKGNKDEHRAIQRKELYRNEKQNIKIT